MPAAIRQQKVTIAAVLTISSSFMMYVLTDRRRPKREGNGGYVEASFFE
jgi:hypothetical protein